MGTNWNHPNNIIHHIRRKIYNHRFPRAISWAFNRIINAFFSSIQSSKFGHYFHHIKADGKFLIAYSWPLVAHAMSICAIIFGSDKSPFLFKSILIFCISYSLINTCTVITNTFHLNKMKHNFDILSRQHTE